LGPNHSAEIDRPGGTLTQGSTVNHQFDLVVVGAGSGGFAAARTARELGASVAVVDRGPLGGLCILRGCMPSKTLIATGDAAYEIRHSGDLGVHASAPTIDFPAVMARKREVIQGFTDYRVAGIETFPLFSGEAVFESPHNVRVGDDVLEGKNFVIATGSVIAPPVFPGLEEVGYIESDEALELETPPESMIVLGGGYVGSELTQFYARIGVKSTILIRSGHLLTDEDGDIGEALTEYFREEGIAVETNAHVTRVSRNDAGLKVVHYLHDGVEKSVAAHEIFYALGRLPNVNGINLEAAGVTYHAMTGIEVDDTMRTSQSHIFAVGDVTGRFALVHIAIQQGELAARNAINTASEHVDYSLSKTHTVFSDPQVAIAGETEKELIAAGIPYLVASAPFNDHGKAISIAKTKGFVKMMAAPSDGRILGAAIIGANGSDLIHEMIVALYYRSTVFDFVKIPHLHPTMAEIWTYPAEELVAQIVAERPLAMSR
jgi:pyruvate/2-oxoglutarate dehydrogenase complex dihydrolipoamide dehydrogenase (E3) component